MSPRSISTRLAAVRTDAQLVVEHADDQARQLAALVAAAEEDVRDAAAQRVLERSPRRSRGRISVLPGCTRRGRLRRHSQSRGGGAAERRVHRQDCRRWLEALIAAYEMRPSVIVMDVSMPVLDGLEATRLIKACAVTRDARIIAYTGNPSFDESPTRMLFAAVLTKPALPDAVLAAVRDAAGL